MKQDAGDIFKLHLHPRRDFLEKFKTALLVNK
jgi:hypothetical protein